MRYEKEKERGARNRMSGQEFLAHKASPRSGPFGGTRMMAISSECVGARSVPRHVLLNLRTKHEQHIHRPQCTLMYITYPLAPAWLPAAATRHRTRRLPRGGGRFPPRGPTTLPLDRGHTAHGETPCNLPPPPGESPPRTGRVPLPPAVQYGGWPAGPAAARLPPPAPATASQPRDSPVCSPLQSQARTCLGERERTPLPCRRHRHSRPRFPQTASRCRRSHRRPPGRHSPPTVAEEKKPNRVAVPALCASPAGGESRGGGRCGARGRACTPSEQRPGSGGEWRYVGKGGEVGDGLRKEREAKACQGERRRVPIGLDSGEGRTTQGLQLQQGRPTSGAVSILEASISLERRVALHVQWPIDQKAYPRPCSQRPKSASCAAPSLSRERLLVHPVREVYTRPIENPISPARTSSQPAPPPPSSFSPLACPWLSSSSYTSASAAVDDLRSATLPTCSLCPLPRRRSSMACKRRLTLSSAEAACSIRK
eukprot:scaffold22558_cov113-Isochrysis_galbana.AAC.1